MASLFLAQKLTKNEQNVSFSLILSEKHRFERIYVASPGPGFVRKN